MREGIKSCYLTFLLRVLPVLNLTTFDTWILIFSPVRAKRALWKWDGRFMGAKEKDLGFGPKSFCTVTLQQGKLNRLIAQSRKSNLKRHSPSLQTMHRRASHNSVPSECSLPSKVHLLFSMSRLPHDSQFVHGILLTLVR